MDLWSTAPWASWSEALTVDVGAVIHAAHCCSISPMSSSSSDQSTMTCQHAKGSLIETPPLLRGGGVFGFFFFFIGSAWASCFPCDGYRCLGVFSTTSSDEDDELLSEGGPAGAWVARASMPFGQVPSDTSKTYTARSYPQVFKNMFQHQQDLTLQGLPTVHSYQWWWIHDDVCHSLPHVAQFGIT